MKYKVVLFDLDGTLLDTLEDLATAVNYTLSLRGFPLHTLGEYRLMVGHGVRNLVALALPEDLREDALIDTCLAEFKAYYTAHIDVHTHPFPGMQELLRTLHGQGVGLAVASNKFQSGTEYLIRRFFGDVPFVAVLGNREGFPLKPDPKIVGEVLRRAGAVRHPRHRRHLGLPRPPRGYCPCPRLQRRRIGVADTGLLTFQRKPRRQNP